MVNSSEGNDRRSRLESELTKRFDAASVVLEAVLDSSEKARQMDELADLHWDDPRGIAEDIESFSRGHGLQAGWNSWIGIQRTDTSHLTIDAEK